MNWEQEAINADHVCLAGLIRLRHVKPLSAKLQLDPPDCPNQTWKLFKNNPFRQKMSQVPIYPTTVGTWTRLKPSHSQPFVLPLFNQ